MAHDPVYAIADEDLDRETGEKTSSVHFLRFELSSDMIAALRQNASLSMGIDHPAYDVSSGPITGRGERFLDRRPRLRIPLHNEEPSEELFTAVLDCHYGPDRVCPEKRGGL